MKYKLLAALLFVSSFASSSPISAPAKQSTEPIYTETVGFARSSVLANDMARCQSLYDNIHDFSADPSKWHIVVLYRMSVEGTNKGFSSHQGFEYKLGYEYKSSYWNGFYYLARSMDKNYIRTFKDLYKRFDCSQYVKL